MKIHDITLSVSAELPVYPGDPPFMLEPVSRIAAGEGANVSRISCSTHCGTHLDAPYHFNDQMGSVDNLPLSLLIGSAMLVEFSPDVKEIGREQLEHLPIRNEARLLLKTGNSELWERKEFSEEYAHLTEEGAGYLLEMGVRLVGIDYLSIERYAGPGSVHRLLLDNGVVILEGLNLKGVGEGRYELICLPMKIKGGDGAPVRAVLRTRDHSHPVGEFDPHTSRWPLS